MWRCIVLFGILVASPVIGRCDTVQFTVDSSSIGNHPGPGNIDFFSSGLDGIVLSGQSLSLDLVLGNEVLARLFLSDPSAFGIELIVNTNAMGFPGFAGSTTGFLLSANGNEFGESQNAGRSGGSDGTFDIGLVSFTSGNLEGASVVDVSGVQFDTTFPATGFVVTNAQLRFTLNSAYDSVEFGTAQQLPEPSTIGLTLLGMLLVALTAWRKGPRPSSRTA
jgi:hypothetical protein